MKLFDVNWSTVLRELSRWSMLSVDARRVLLEALKTSGYSSGAEFGAHRDEIVASGIPTFDAARNRLNLAEGHRELLKVLRAMGRHMVFDEPSIPSLVGYMEEHFTNDDINRLGAHTAGVGFGHSTRASIAPRVAFAGWPGDLLAAASDAELLEWGAARGIPATAPDGAARVRALQTLMRQLVAEKEAVPLSVWYTKLSARDRVLFAGTLHLGLAHLVLFVGLRGRDLEPMIGLWPTAVQELTRPSAVKPLVVVPVEQFEAAVLMEDMTALLATVVAAPVRVRVSDMAVFARTRGEVESRLVPVPAWAVPMVVSPYVTRIDVAAATLGWRTFVHVREHHQSPRLESTAAGAKWLALSSHARLTTMLDPMRRSKARNPSASYEGGDEGRFFPFSMPYYRVPKELDLRRAVTSAFLDLGDGFYPVEAFLDYGVRSANPFFALTRAAINDLQRQIHFGGADPRAGMMSLWRGALSSFLTSRLVAFGGARLGRLASGELCFAVTDVGRYLLGATDRFVYGVAGVAEIVVQPNFDIVFLGAAPSLEAAMARVAERVGVAPGLAFRITRASVMRAAESGLTADAVLATLGEASSKPVPQNVRREIAGWMSAVRRAMLRVVEVIDCGNDETADRVVALLGGKSKRLGATMIELSAATTIARAALIKKLRAGGVFLEDQTGRAKAPTGRARRAEPMWDGE